MRNTLLKLFNLDAAELDAAGGWSLRFTSEWAAPVVVFGCIALVVLVWQVYKREKGTASPWFKTMLALFRVMALAALVFALLAPAVVVRKSELKEAWVIILADNSDSMNLRDRYRDEALLARLVAATGLAKERDPAAALRAMSRAEIANAVLANSKYDLPRLIAQNCRVRKLVFASRVSAAPAPERKAPGEKSGGSLLITPKGATTQIGECIREAIAKLRGQRIAAMVVLSDWCSNSGISPVEATRYALAPKSTFPIFTVGVGDPARQRNIAITRVSVNPVAFLNDPLIFNVAIEQSGYDGAVVPLELRIGDDLVASKQVQLKSGRNYHTISHRPKKTGECTYVIHVPKRKDEFSDEKNSVRRTVTVKDDKVRVLLVSGGPTWEWRYLKAALWRDTSVKVSVWLQSADPEWVMAGGKQLEQMPLNKKELVDDYDVIVMLGASANLFSPGQLENVRSFVGDFGGGLIFAAGAHVVTEAFSKTALAKCLPVSLKPPSGFSPTSAARHSWQPRITPEGWAHPLTKLSEDPHQNRELWDGLPGLFWYHPVGKARPAARVLAVHPTEKTERGPLTIFAEQRYGAGKVFFSATDETWRWRFVIGDRYFYRFWRQIIGLAASNKLLGNAKRLTLSVAKSSYRIGQKVEIEVKCLDDMLRPSSQKSLLVTIDLPGGSARKLRLGVDDPTQGIYRGSFVARRAGNYAAWTLDSFSGKRETVPFDVSTSTLESESNRLNVEVMQAVAERTGAEAFMIDRIDQIPDKIKSESVNIWTEHPREIWDSWGCLILFVIPLTCEWWLRKRRLLT